jgi:hypothetical protein
LGPELADGKTRTLIISSDKASIADESLAAAKLYSLASRRFNSACISSKKAVRSAPFAFEFLHALPPHARQRFAPLMLNG